MKILMDERSVAQYSLTVIGAFSFGRTSFNPSMGRDVPRE